MDVLNMTTLTPNGVQQKSKSNRFIRDKDLMDIPIIVEDPLQGVGNMEDNNCIADAKEGIHIFRPNNAVTYRIVHVPDTISSESETITLNQALSQTSTSFITSNNTTQSIPTMIASPINQVYVLGSGDEVYTSKPLVKKPAAVRSKPAISGSNPLYTPSKIASILKKEDKRKVSHREIERRRRDKINNWIFKLAKLIPDCTGNTNGNCDGQSKGGILAKACEYIVSLRDSNNILAETLKSTESINDDLDAERKENEMLKHENNRLRSMLLQYGVPLKEIEHEEFREFKDNTR